MDLSERDSDPPYVVKLHSSPWDRMLRWLIAPISLAMGVGLLTVPFLPWEGTNDPLERVLVTAIVTGLGFLGCTTAWIVVRPVFGQPRLELYRDHMIVIHPGVLRRRARVPHTNIAAVAVRAHDQDPSWDPDDFDLIREENGFTVYAGKEERAEALSVMTKFVFPVLSHSPIERTNMLVVFEVPQDMEARRGALAGFTVSGVKKMSGRSHRGFVARAADASSSKDAFLHWGIRPRATKELAGALEPSDADIRRIRAARWVAWGAVLYAVLSLVRVAADVWPR